MKNNSYWTQERQETFQKGWAKMTAKAWTDTAFEKRLKKEPLVIFKEFGIEFPPGVNCKIEENSEKIIHLTLPLKPEGNLSDKELKAMANLASNPPLVFHQH